MSELARVASDGDETVTMIFPPERGQVIFRMPDIELVSQLIDGNFPDFRQVIPIGHKTRTVVSTEAVFEVLQTGGDFCAGKFPYRPP